MASCSFNFSAPPTLGILCILIISIKINHCNNTNFTGTSREPPAPPGLLLLGGQTTDGLLSSVETFGFENCSIPGPLPETRYGFGSFIAFTHHPTKLPQLAVCGGWWMGKPTSTDCLTLNITSGQWERGTFTNGLLGEGVRGVINIDGEGVFVVQSYGISSLAPDSQSWAAGPVYSESAECGCIVSSTSFVTIHMSDTYNVREYDVTNGEAELKPESWPNLLTKRYGPGCGATSSHLVVAGGVSGMDEVLNSVEVFNIGTKALRRGGNLRQARAFFQIIPVGLKHPRLLAIGGQNETATLDTSEWWEQEEDSWEEGPTASTPRSNFAALMAPPHLVCLEVDQPAHLCPADQNTGQTCVFPTVESGGSMTISFYPLYMRFFHYLLKTQVHTLGSNF